MHSFICTHTQTLTLLNLLKLALLKTSWQLFKPIKFQHCAKHLSDHLCNHIATRMTLALCWLVLYPCSSTAFIHWTQNLWLWVVKLSDRTSNSCFCQPAGILRRSTWKSQHTTDTKHTHTGGVKMPVYLPAAHTESKHKCVCLCKRAAPANNIACDPSTCLRSHCIHPWCDEETPEGNH